MRAFMEKRRAPWLPDGDRPSGTFSRVLVANRGEIAVRLIRGCREAGLERALLRRRRAGVARQARRPGGASDRQRLESYLSIEALIAAARRSGAQAIHPLRVPLERSAFARAVESAGLTFIGPPADVIERMGIEDWRPGLMTRAGVPIVPGETPADQSDDGIAAAPCGSDIRSLISVSLAAAGMRTVRPVRIRCAAHPRSPPRGRRGVW